MWPTHKYLCGKDPETFFIAPLTLEERSKVHDRRYELFIDGHERSIGNTRQGLEEHLKFLGFFNGTLE